jgi:cytidine deaminase
VAAATSGGVYLNNPFLQYEKIVELAEFTLRSLRMAEPSTDELLQLAWAAREQAYVPYSGFAVGAALLSSDGRVFTGCNVENISFGLTNCAERVAIGTAIAAGVKEFTVVAVVSDSGEPVVPCGACRQVLAEFAPHLRVISATKSGGRREWQLDQLLPQARQGILG